ncbi:MAG: NAD-dependent epimerase/dehydratase family protein [Gammaproteobacteria bacterium]
MAKKRLIVLGGGGFVGSHLMDRLLSDGGYEIFGFDVTSKKCAQHLGNPNLHFRETYIDATTAEAELGHIVDKVDAVVSLAAVCNPSQYVSNPLYTINSNFIHAYKLVDLCAEAGTWLIHTSTCEVYGRTVASYLRDNDYSDPCLYEQIEDETPLVMGPIANQRWSYATAKALLERYIYANHTERGLPFTIIRPYNWFGPRMDFIPGRDGEGIPRVLACFMTALLDGQPMKLVDGGAARRTITYIDDAIDALVRMLNEPACAQNHFFNIGNRANEISIADLAQMMREVYAEITSDPSYLDHPIEHVSGHKFYGQGYEDCDRRVASVARAARLLRWKAKTDLRDTLRITMRHFYEVYGKATSAHVAA